MKNTVLVGILVVAVGYAAQSSDALADSDYKVCESTYALCTTAECMAIPGTDENVSCTCNVRTGYSVGSTPCAAVKETSKGKSVLSRYYPVKSYARCANNRPWAWCFDKTCVVDKDDPTQATCTCSVVKDKGDYVIVTDTYTASTCTTDLYSSATVTQLNEVTDFLKSEKKLRPFDVEILNVPRLGAADAGGAGTRQ